MPVPISPTVCGLPAALSVIATEPVREPYLCWLEGKLNHARNIRGNRSAINTRTTVCDGEVARVGALDGNGLNVQKRSSNITQGHDLWCAWRAERLSGEYNIR